MTKSKYFEIREQIAIQQKLSECLSSILFLNDWFYPLQTMTLLEVEEYLRDKISNKEMEIKDNMNVR